MKKLQALAPVAQVRRGGYMRDFFKEEKFKRRVGERLADWITRWGEGVEWLSRDGIDFFKVPDLPGWFFLEQAALGEDRQGFCGPAYLRQSSMTSRP